jgi:3-hydroxy-9,10-secoandrosta-1,3,5(10)-triene-9,17-dione monooxygenase reductase component
MPTTHEAALPSWGRRATRLRPGRAPQGTGWVVAEAAMGESAIDPEVFRTVLGHFCTGVVVVTGKGDEDPSGLTCQSFTALSLDPPLVLISVSGTSRSWARIRPTGLFCVNVLGADQDHLSRRFATSGGDKFSGVEWRHGAGGTPVLADVVAHVECEIEATYPGGDHEIVVGRVLHLYASGGTDPLLFFRGSYGRYRELPDL